MGSTEPNPNSHGERKKMKTFRMNSEKEKKRKIQRREEPNPRSIRMSKKRKENLTLDPFGCQRKEKEEQQIREKKRKNPNPNHRANPPFAGVGEEEPSRGQLLAGLGQGGAAARPLDGGVLTRWGARALARGPATAPWSLHRLARSRFAARCSLR